MPTTEVWKDIKEYEGLYQVSNFGNVRSLTRFTIGIRSKKLCNILIKERILKPIISRGYLSTALHKNNKSYTHLIHRLVAQTFINNPDNKRTVNHINGIKTDNTLENLEWATDKENITHAIRTGLYTPKTNKKFEIKVECIETGIIYNSANVAGLLLNTSGSHIGECCKKIRKSANGLHWQYIN